MESATMFYAPSGNPFVLCTTSPSLERELNGGEWPFISPVASSPATVPAHLEHRFLQLGKSKPILAGAVSVNGYLVAMLENTGILHLFSLTSREGGGLRTAGSPVVLTKKLWKGKMSLISTTSLRFHVDKTVLYLLAVHFDGTVIRKRFGYRSASSPVS